MQITFCSLVRSIGPKSREESKFYAQSSIEFDPLRPILDLSNFTLLGCVEAQFYCLNETYDYLAQFGCS
jgi:hypothetical protein